MAEKVRELCSTCQQRDGTIDIRGLAMHEIGSELRLPHAYLFFACRECGQDWTLIGEVGTGAEPYLAKGLVRA